MSQKMNENITTLLAPTGKLRAAINFGNAVLAKEDPDTGAATGVTVDLAHELAQRLGLALELKTYRGAGLVVEAVKQEEVDIAFVAIDPLRAEDVAYTAAYVVIEGAYLVKQSSVLTDNSQVDKRPNRVVVAKGSAYDLYLSRELKEAVIERAATSQGVVDHFLAVGAEVAAGVKQQLEIDVSRLGGLRLLPGRFMAIHQAMGTPHSRQAALSYLSQFIEEMKANGFVAKALQRHGIKGAAVAPPHP
jgi:polar amino acid transport system substrate-binding protein